MSVEQSFADLFEGRPGVVGRDDPEGGPPRPYRLEYVSYAQMVNSHLLGRDSIGVYPMHNDRVRWGCVDFDDGESRSWEQARTLHLVLSALGVEAWIERSRSKGYHVWIFADAWIEARVVREVLIGACALAGASDREVNPKSVHLAPEQLGNFVRLPFYAAFIPPIPRSRQIVLSRRGEPYTLAVFVERATRHRVDAGVLAGVHRQVHIEPEPETAVQMALLDRSQPWALRLNEQARRMLDRGPRDLSDRSGWLYALGMACGESGLARDEVFAALSGADEMWCAKYSARPDSAVRYDEIARMAAGRVGGVA